VRRFFGGGSGPRVDKLVVGLGNPGDGYANTRHNVGFAVASRLGKRARAEFGIKSADSRIAEGSVGGITIAIARPQTFMNDSGRAVKKLLDRYRLERFPRIRVGVAPAKLREVPDLADYVLSPFEDFERDVAEKTIDRAAEAAEVALRDVQRAMNQFNG
jgi:PTH1 family peptidyl-tRNA hydrolase